MTLQPSAWSWDNMILFWNNFAQKYTYLRHHSSIRRRELETLPAMDTYQTSILWHIIWISQNIKEFVQWLHATSEWTDAIFSLHLPQNGRYEPHFPRLWKISTRLQSIRCNKWGFSALERDYACFNYGGGRVLYSPVDSVHYVVRTTCVFSCNRSQLATFTFNVSVKSPHALPK